MLALLLDVTSTSLLRNIIIIIILTKQEFRLLLDVLANPMIYVTSFN